MIITVIFQKKIRIISQMNDYIAGSITGVVVSITGHPLDTLKTIKQTKNSHLITPKKWYRVYNGISFPLAGSLVIHSSTFGTNKYLFNKFNNHYLSGLITGILTTSIITPIELYKVRAQNMLSLKVNPYKGFSPTIIRESIASSIYFGSYNQMRDSGVNILLAGGLGGWFSWLSTYPIDVCKTRMQSGKTNTIMESLRMGSLWKGFGYCSVRCFIANAAGFFAYEKTLEALKLKNL
ncbi:MAG: hypothetical protein HOA34_06795 [Flavobacterium sp.]|jgi:solute carrier family 25 (mitochondrial carnitine/acylcarnitine transporter), member 20/29|nr:hypothetical protein [Flavobacterium sp.]